MGQLIFNSTNLIMPHQFVQNKFVQDFVVVSLLIYKTSHDDEKFIDYTDNNTLQRD